MYRLTWQTSRSSFGSSVPSRNLAGYYLADVGEASLLPDSGTHAVLVDLGYIAPETRRR